MRSPYKAYSYCDDSRVPEFDDSTPIIVFDGKCVLCSSGVQWVITRDRDGDSIFAAIQEEIPQALYKHYGLDVDAFDTFMVLQDGIPYVRWQGVCAAARLMPAPWRWLGQAGRIVPSFIGDAIYDFVQRNRLDWFGATDICFVPNEIMKKRFLAFRH